MSADEVLLDAALDRFEQLGVTRTTADDIAKQAGVDRTTLYRRVGKKDAIVQAALAFEMTRTVQRIEAAVNELDSFDAQLTDGFAHTVLTLRQHPLLRRALAIDREWILSALTTDSGPLLQAAAEHVMRMYTNARERFAVQTQLDDATAAALCARLIHSLVLVPDAPPVLKTREELRTFAERTLLPALLGQRHR